MISIAELSRFNLQPGELRLSREPAILGTILGSCVGVTFWSERLRVGALCHGVLPRCPEKWSAGFTSLDGHRYVDFSIRYLAKQFDTLGAHRQEWKSRYLVERTCSQYLSLATPNSPSAP